MPELIKCHLGTVADPEDRAGGAGEGGQRAVPQAWVQRAKPPLGSLGGALRPPPRRWSMPITAFCVTVKAFL